MTLILYSDPHLGVNRTANTTPASRKLLREKIKETVHQILYLEGDKICGGDLFDTYSNNEQVIKDGGYIIDRTALTIAGNHDIAQDADKIGSLQLLAQTNLGNNFVDVVTSEFNKVVFDYSIQNGHLVFAVPHHTTQELFERALEGSAEQAAAYHQEHKLKLLLLHCNYNSGFAEDSETALNLTSDKAKALLSVFDYVFLGHEHEPAEHHDDRVIIIGNVHPTGFSDVSDKRVIRITDDGIVESIPVWTRMDGYDTYSCHELPEQTHAQFVEISGEVEPGDLAALARGVRKLWKNSPDLLALRLTTHAKALASVPPGHANQSLVTLPAIIKAELASRPELKSLWEEFSDE